MNPLRVALLGFGVVGSGTYHVLMRNQLEIVRRVGRAIEIAAIVDLDIEKVTQATASSVAVSNDAMAVIQRADIDVVIELIGGYTVAKKFVLAAIEAGKHVVTANKALLATYGNEIFAAARAKGVILAFEAAVAGGIPVIKAVREGLTANRIQWIAGIINGTSNFILSEMRSKGLPFADVLQQAQALGYAEADPTFDIEGVDAAHKLTLLSALAFGTPLQFEHAYVEGISKLEQADIQYAEQLGYRLKLLGITRRTADGVELRVHPCLIPSGRLIANVEGVMNAVLVKGDAVGPTLYYGAGAGSEATASAVVADLVDIARLQHAQTDHRVPYSAFQHEYIQNLPVLPMDEVRTSFYLRMRVADLPGVLAEITRILAAGSISIGAMIQKEPSQGQSHADIVLLTHQCREGDVCQAIAAIESLDTVVSEVTRIRLEELN